MKRTASEILRDLEIRVARLEKQALYTSEELMPIQTFLKRNRIPHRLTSPDGIPFISNYEDVTNALSLLGEENISERDYSSYRTKEFNYKGQKYQIIRSRDYKHNKYGYEIIPVKIYPKKSNFNW